MVDATDPPVDIRTADQPVDIRPADPDDPRVAVLVAEHLDEMEPTAPPESRHALTVDQFRSSGVRLWVAEADGDLVGSVALQDLGDGHLELKAMRTRRSLRGTGLGRRLLMHALSEARVAGAARVSLETGTSPVFDPARALYASHGFAPCPPFGSYRPDPHSVFLTLDPGAPSPVDD
ncbi:MAG: GNAT family N-acetyltransferase [Dermatophilaceae bacterium]